MIWDAGSAEAGHVAQSLITRVQAAPHGLNATLRREGMAVFKASSSTGGNQSHLLHMHSGAIIGSLFERPDGDENGISPRRARLHEQEAACILTGEGRRLISNYWGRYVAFLWSLNGQRKHVLRDPSGGLPCFWFKFRGVEVFFSFVEDVVRLKLQTFAVNWKYLAARVVDSQIQSADTALEGISEVRAGECVTIERRHASKRFFWNPCQIAQSAIIEDADSAARSLRATTRACVQAWGSCHEGILQQLSGGLDSSIVLSCFTRTDARPRILCVNDYSHGSDTDERMFARVAAQRAGVALVERQRDATIPLECTLQQVRSVAPRYSLNWSRGRPSDRELMEKNKATALFTGRGGDQLFYTGRREWPATDFVYRHGIRPSLFRIALDLGYMDPTSRCVSVWTTIRHALRYGLSVNRSDPFKRVSEYAHRRLVRREVIEQLRTGDPWLHPWFKNTNGVPPGKAMHAYRLSFPEPYYDFAAGLMAPEPVHPLASQPLMELCLRIPTYLAMSRGWDRAVARAAFASDLPREIARRRTKGGIDDHAIDIVRRNVGFIAEFLLEGALVRHGFLDPVALRTALGGEMTELHTDTLEILDHVQTEAWLRLWTGVSPARARSMPVRSVEC
ncbi:MAG: asparagine synthase-related protein [Gammaproteobacteria bacterium]